MLSSRTLKKSAICSLMASMLAASQSIFADTRLQIPVIPENTQVYNALVIEHGCDDLVNGGTGTPVFGQSVVFPDSAANPIITVDGVRIAQPLTDFVVNWGNSNQKIQSNDVFPLEAEKTVSGNVVGFWGGNGKLPGTYIGLNPFVTGAVLIEPTSCAKSVTFVLAIADVCKMTSLGGFNTDTVNLWTPAVGSNYDGNRTNEGFDSPATLTVTRNLTVNPLPPSCRAAVDVVVKPSASQINRDMPVVINGKQEWPLLQ